MAADVYISGAKASSTIAAALNAATPLLGDARCPHACAAALRCLCADACCHTVCAASWRPIASSTGTRPWFLTPPPTPHGRILAQKGPRRRG